MSAGGAGSIFERSPGRYGPEPEEIQRLVVVEADCPEPGSVPYAVMFSAHPGRENPHYRVTVDFLESPDEEVPGEGVSDDGIYTYAIAEGLDYGYLNRIWRREALEDLPRELVRPIELYAPDYLSGESA